MKFILGLLTGIIVGAVGAVAYSVQSGRDLRDTVEQLRGELNDRDMEALGARVQTGITQMQSQFDEKLNQVRGKTPSAIDETSAAAQSVVDDVAGAVQDGADKATDAAQKGGDTAATAASKAVETASAAAKP